MALLSLQNAFLYNHAETSGGAIHCDSGTIHITGNCSFESNYVATFLSQGGAIAMWYQATLVISGTVVFSKNQAVYGGAIDVYKSKAYLNGNSILLLHNVAEEGGGILLSSTAMEMKSRHVEFVNNTAKRFGGGLRVISAPESRGKVEISATFKRNRANCGGAISITNKQVNMIFMNITVVENMGSALCLSNCNITFYGTTKLSYNAGENGGGIRSTGSFLIFVGYTFFSANSAEAGGAINSLQGGIIFYGLTQFTHNRADFNGGAIYAVGSPVILGENRPPFDDESVTFFP